MSPRAVVFFAVRVPKELARQEHEHVRRALSERDFRFPRPEGWHVTLFYLGDVERAGLDALCEGLRAPVGELTAPTLAFTEPGAFPRRGRERVLWLGAREEPRAPASLDALYDTVLAAVEAFGCDTATERSRPYVPHITVARPKARRPKVPASFYAHIPEGSWRPPALELLESVRGDGPARYETLASVPFGKSG